MRNILAILCFFLLPLSSADAGDIAVPEGFVLQPLTETDGQIARPKDWFYTSKGTASGWVWTLSKEDPAMGSYETGLRVQLLVGVAEKSGKTREAFAKHFISGKRAAAEVMHECPKIDLGEFYRQCIEVIESLPSKAGSSSYRIIYSVMWGKELDMVVVSTFGSPPQAWETAAPIAEAMAHFRLLGPKLGK